MEQGTISVPNRFTFDRFTATAVWFPGSASPSVDGGFHLGVIDGQSLDEGISREKVMIARDGAVTLAYDEAVSVAPIFQLKGKQFMSTILPLLYMGTAGGTAHQGTSISTVVVPALLGKTLDLGARGLVSVVVDVASVVKTPDVDYFVDAGKGLIRFPLVAAGIAGGDSVNVTFTRPNLNRETYTAFNSLNQVGNLQLFLMDGKFAPPVMEIFMPGSLSRDKSNDGDPAKTNQWQLRFAVEGQPTILRLAAWDNLLLDDGSVLAYA